MSLRKQILEIIEKDSRISHDTLAAMLGSEPAEVERIIHELESEKIIAGYHALINWDKADSDDVSAIIEVKVNPQRGQGYDRIAKKIYQFDEVEAVYLISGGYDLSVELKKAPMREIANFVSTRLSLIEEVQSTATHVILKKYKDHGTILEDDDTDKRMVVSP